MNRIKPLKPVIPSAAKGGTYYELAKKLKETINEFLGFQVNVMHTAGSNDNIKMISEKEAFISFSSSAPLHEAYKENNITNLRVLFPLYTAYFHGWSLDSKQLNFQNMNGKKVAIGPAGGTSAEYVSKLLKKFNIDPAEIHYIEWFEANKMLENGLIDSGLTINGTPQGSIEQLANEKELQIFGMNSEEISQSCNAFPFFSSSEIVADTYAKQNKPISTIGMLNWTITNEELSEEMAYNLTKLFFEQHDEIKTANVAFEELNIQEILNSPISIHEGAKKYYKEQGVISN